MTAAPSMDCATAAWQHVRLPAPAGCHRLEVSAKGTAALHAQIATSVGWIPLPLFPAPEGLGITFRLSERVETLRIKPFAGAALHITDLRLEPTCPWTSLLPDWSIGPLALPPRPQDPGTRPRSLPAPHRLNGWDRRIGVHATEAATIDGESVEAGQCGVLALTFDPPLPAGRHRIEGRFLTPGGSEAAVVPRLLVPGRARDPLDGVPLRPLGNARLGAIFTLPEPAGVLLLRPREQRGRVVVRDLRLGPVSRLGLVTGALARMRPARHLSAPPARALAITPAPARAGDTAPVACIVTATRDAPHHLARFLATVGRGTRVPFEVVLVDNGTRDATALRLLSEAAERPGFTVLRDEGPFNFAALTNLGAAQARAPVLVLANNDLEFPAAEWLAPLVDAARDPRVAVAGARLLYPSGRIQHDGLSLAGEARVAHDGRFARPWRRPRLEHGRARPVTAVTGALMALDRALYERLGGMRPDRYPVLLNDVDLCLRAAREGRTNVIAACEVIHHESASIGPQRRDDPLARGGPAWRLGRALEADHFRTDWADALDAAPASTGDP